MKRTLSILLIIVALATGCCKFEWYPPLPTELPPVTEEGKNTFGCLIEDEIYVPAGRRITMEPILQINYFPTHPYYYFSVTTHRFVDYKGTDPVMDAHVRFGSDSIYTIGTYTLDGTVTYNNNWYQALPGTTSLTITKLDTIKGIISGQFYFQAIENNNFLPIDRLDPNSKVITISNGRFDLKR